MGNKAKVVLVVDDEQSLREVLVERLRKEGVSVLDASSGEEGIEVLKEQSVDLIILDMALGKMDGAEFNAQLTQMGMDTIPVIVLTNLDPVLVQDTVKEVLIKANTPLEQVIAKVKQYLSLGDVSAES